MMQKSPVRAFQGESPSIEPGLPLKVAVNAFINRYSGIQRGVR